MLIFVSKIVGFLLVFSLAIKLATIIDNKMIKPVWIFLLFFFSTIIPSLLIDPLPNSLKIILTYVGVMFVIIIFELTRKKIEKLKIKF